MSNFCLLPLHATLSGKRDDLTYDKEKKETRWEREEKGILNYLL